MASILRTGKLLRCFAGLTRNLVLNPAQESENGAILRSSTLLCQTLPQRYATASAAKTEAIELDKQLRRLDQDVRRFGRISRRDIEEILDEIRLHRSATSSQSLMVIRCCGNLVPEEMPETRTALVQEIWKTLNALNVPMDISHYNALLRVYLENEHPFSPTDFLAEIESKSLECNRVTYQRLIARYCQQGDIDGATRILEHMREKKLPVNEHVFNSLILGHSQANDLESAKGILGMMKQAGLEPSADTYTTLLCCYARHGQLDALLETLNECEAKDIVLLDKDLLEVIYTLAVNGHGAQVDKLLEKLRLNAGFNQDAVNVVLRLVNKGHEDVGLQILRKMPRSTRADGQPIDVGTFFIRQLVKAQRPIENVLRICKIMQDEGLNPKALLIATEAGLTNGMVNHTLPLLKEMKNAGLPIRQHYFWPLMCTVESNRIMDIIRQMQQEFSINPTSETIREYVIPHLKEKNVDRIISSLRDVGVSPGVAASSAAFGALTNNQLKEAAKIMETYRVNYVYALFRQPLIAAYAKTKDTNAFVRIVRQLHEKTLNEKPNAEAAAAVDGKEEEEQTEIERDEETASGSTSDVVGSLLLDVCAYFRRERIQTLEKILPEFVNQGLPISSELAMRLTEKLGAEMTPKISELLEKMSSGELTLKPLKNGGNSRKRTLDELSIEEIERFITNVEAKGENAGNLKRHLLNACFRSKDLPKTLATIEKLEAEKFSMTMGVWAQLIDLYVHHGKSEEAKALFEKLKAKDADFVLDNVKVIRFAELLLKEERLNEAIALIEQNKKAQPLAEGESSFNYIGTVWRILNGMAEQGDAQKLQQFFETLVKCNFVTPTNALLGPLIKVHLVKDDITAALDAFEKICKQHNATPWKNELACRLIQKEDAGNLQRLTDLSTNIHGEVNSLYDLVFSFVECGRVRQARKILETPGLRTRPHRIENACERYQSEGLTAPLEGLMEATKDLHHIDRSKICFNLLLTYAKAKDAEKALSLWTKMQEENIPPTDAFLVQLSELLKEQGLPIPFAVPQQNVKPASTSSKSAKMAEKIEKAAAASTSAAPTKKDNATSQPVSKRNTNLSLLRKAINAGDVQLALDYKNKLQANEKASALEISHIVELLVRAGRLQEAGKLVDELLAAAKLPQVKIFKFFLNKVAATGDVDTLKKLGEQLNDEQKRIVSYDNRLCHAFIAAGKVEQYLKKLKDEISTAKTNEEVAILAAKFPRGGALGILEKHPEKLAEFEEIAELYAKHNQLGPINVLWMHLISSGNEEASRRLWTKHLSNAPRLMFQRVLQTAREQKDDKLAAAIVNQLRGSKISEGAIGNAFSCLIDIQLTNGNIDKAFETLKTAVKDVCLENINRSALLRLRTALEEQNKEFPFEIPDKKNIKKDITSTTSSDSSDDDIAPKKPETIPSKPLKKND